MNFFSNPKSPLGAYRENPKRFFVFGGGIFFALIIAVEIAVLLGVPMGIREKQEGNYDAELLSYAREVMKTCAQESFRPACYDREIPSLMDFITMEDAFEVAGIIQQEDEEYGYCHVLGHNLSAKEAAKDPERWTDVVKRCPTGICSNGCLHGAAQERFRDDVLSAEQIEAVIPQLVGICDPDETWKLTGIEQSECYHGLGHLTMYITGADLSDSLDVCEEIGISTSGADMRTLCYEGAFMQLFQPLEEEDIALVDGIGPQRKEDLRGFCEGFKTTSRIEACWQEGWPLFREQIQQPQGLVDFCSQSLTRNKESHCHSMLFYVWAQGVNYDERELSQRCSGLPPSVQGKCFGDIANAMIHGGVKNIAKAASFCALAPNSEVMAGCYDLLVRFAAYQIPKDSPEFRALCQSLPQTFMEQCLRAEQPIS